MARSDWTGETLSGRYEILELLGQGGMSAVYKANDPNLRRVVAVKIIHSHLSKDPEFVRRFEEEAAAVAQLRHPNLIQVFDFNNDDETYYIVFEFVPGETLEDRLKRLNKENRLLSVDQTTAIAAQTAEGLHYAHNKGLIHRDVKPANLMINVQNAPIIMDFGIAKIMGGTQHTATGAVLGTARYMSPEQIKGEAIDPRTDIYSLGVTMFEMLGGRPPFNADSAMTLMMMHITDPVPDLHQLREDIPLGLVSIVNKALAKDPDNRFQTAAEFAAALKSPQQTVSVPPAASVGAPARDLEATIVEPIITDAEIVDTGSAAVQTGASSLNKGAFPQPPVSTASSTAASGRSSPNWLYIAGGALGLILLLAVIWAVFLRGDGGGQAEEPPVAAIVPTEPAAEAAVPAEEPTDEPTEEPTLPPTEEPTEEPTEAPTLEPTAVPTPRPAASVLSAAGDVTLTVDDEESPIESDSAITAGSRVSTGEDGQLEFELEDGSIVQMGNSSVLDVRRLARDPTDNEQETIIALISGDFLLRQPQQGNILTLLDGDNNLLGALQTSQSTAAERTRQTTRILIQDTADEAAMAISLNESATEIRIACFAGLCTVGESFALPIGEEIVVDPVNQRLVDQYPIASDSESYLYWQEACNNCLPEVAEAIVEALPTEAPLPTEPPLPTATTAPPTAEPTATEAAPAYFVSITSIGLENGQYIVNYETRGYTEQLPGQHVHFYFDTVPESQAGVPGNGPWILYGGPRPFTQYGESDRPAAASAMCARVANADHSIIYGSGNCYPLP